jgi:hypothetical protein
MRPLISRIFMTRRSPVPAVTRHGNPDLSEECVDYRGGDGPKDGAGDDLGGGVVAELDTRPADRHDQRRGRLKGATSRLSC